MILCCIDLTSVTILQGNLSVETTRLLKSLLPATCLWTSLRDKKEGFDYETTIEELKQLYPPSEAGSDSQTQNEESMIEDEAMEGMEGVPKAIRDMLKCKSAVESLGSMIWFVLSLGPVVLFLFSGK